MWSEGYARHGRRSGAISVFAGEGQGGAGTKTWWLRDLDPDAWDDVGYGYWWYIHGIYEIPMMEFHYFSLAAGFGLGKIFKTKELPFFCWLCFRCCWQYLAGHPFPPGHERHERWAPQGFTCNYDDSTHDFFGFSFPSPEENLTKWLLKV